MDRRDFLRAAASAPYLGAQPPELRTFVYKRLPGCDIKADVHSLSGGVKPVAVWIHGGALIAGSRRLSPNSRVLRALIDAGFRVVSIDYRLAPETKLPGIIEDLVDAFVWIRAQAAALEIDPARITVCGASAGGYLTLMSGYRISPPPKALVSFWGYGDIVGDWYSRPDPFYLKQPAVSREEAFSAVGSTPISEPPEPHNRFRFYLYCRQQGLWPREVAGRDPSRDARWFWSYCPLHNVTGRYPPTLLVHGTADTDVPYEQSRLMADRLRQARVRHRLFTVPEGAHGLGNIDPAEQDRIYRDAAGFLRSAL